MHPSPHVQLAHLVTFLSCDKMRWLACSSQAHSWCRKQRNRKPAKSQTWKTSSSSFLEGVPSMDNSSISALRTYQQKRQSSRRNHALFQLLSWLNPSCDDCSMLSCIFWSSLHWFSWARFSIDSVTSDTIKTNLLPNQYRSNPANHMALLAFIYAWIADEQCFATKWTHIHKHWNTYYWCFWKNHQILIYILRASQLYRATYVKRAQSWI